MRKTPAPKVPKVQGLKHLWGSGVLIQEIQSLLHPATLLF